MYALTRTLLAMTCNNLLRVCGCGGVQKAAAWGQCPYFHLPTAYTPPSPALITTGVFTKATG